MKKKKKQLQAFPFFLSFLGEIEGVAFLLIFCKSHVRLDKMCGIDYLLWTLHLSAAESKGETAAIIDVMLFNPEVKQIFNLKTSSYRKPARIDVYCCDIT